MSLYSRLIFPRLLDFSMRYEELGKVRSSIIPDARGAVLEIGIGSGLNLPFYTADAVTQLYGVDPAGDLLAMARTRASAVRFPVRFFQQDSGEIPLPDNSIDTAVVTWSLCSIPNPLPTLREARRVLKEDGRLIFAEHGLSPDIAVQSWQNRLTPLWRVLAGGCHLNRKMDDLIRSAGFSIVKLETAYIPGPRPATYMYVGVGTRT